MSLRDYLIQAGLVLLAAGGIVGVRYLLLRREKPAKRKPRATKK